ncbi:MAG: Ig-like domain-containing protein [Spirochaetota bacterium]
MVRKNAAFMWVLVASLLLSGCSWFLPEEDAVLVRRTVSPAADSTGVQVDTDVVVSVSSQIDEALVTDSWLVVVDDNDEPVSGSLSAFGGELTLLPDSQLEYDTTYTATVSGSVTGTNGATLGESYTWSFTTEVNPV